MFGDGEDEDESYSRKRFIEHDDNEDKVIEKSLSCIILFIQSLFLSIIEKSRKL
jgi:hypothetical protein